MDTHVPLIEIHSEQLKLIQLMEKMRLSQTGLSTIIMIKWLIVISCLVEFVVSRLE